MLWVPVPKICQTQEKETKRNCVPDSLITFHFFKLPVKHKKHALCRGRNAYVRCKAGLNKGSLRLKYRNKYSYRGSQLSYDVKQNSFKYPLWQDEDVQESTFVQLRALNCSKDTGRKSASLGSRYVFLSCTFQLPKINVCFTCVLLTASPWLCSHGNSSKVIKRVCPTLKLLHPLLALFCAVEEDEHLLVWFLLPEVLQM